MPKIGSKYEIFPEKEYRGLSPNFHIHVSVSKLYIPTMELPFLLEEICGPILGIYKSLTDTWMYRNWGWGRAISRKGICKQNCLCSAYTKGSMDAEKVPFQLPNFVIEFGPCCWTLVLWNGRWAYRCSICSLLSKLQWFLNLRYCSMGGET